jgi:hypothetical protein
MKRYFVKRAQAFQPNSRFGIVHRFPWLVVDEMTAEVICIIPADEGSLGFTQASIDKDAEAKKKADWIAEKLNS